MNNEEIRSKIEYMYIMLLYSIMKEDINRVKHHLSDELVEHYRQVIENNISRNIVQKYGELNVSSVDIISNRNGIITAKIVAKYIDYRINRTTRKFIDGEKERSTHIITLKIRYQEHNKSNVYRCPSCGAVLNVNLTSICQYCNEPLEDEESVYVIESINF